jgi:hypothetical protein
MNLAGELIHVVSVVVGYMLIRLSPLTG